MRQYSKRQSGHRRVAASQNARPDSSTKRNTVLGFMHTIRILRQSLSALGLPFVCLILAACAGPVALPQVGQLPVQDTFAGTEDSLVQSLRPLVPAGTATRVGLSAEAAQMPRAGAQTVYGSPVSKELETAYDAYLSGEGATALTSLDKELTNSQSAISRWHASHLRTQALIMMGRSGEALDEIARTSRLETAVFGTNISSLALRGETKVWLGDYRGAQVDLIRVVNALKHWRMPTSFGGPPSNLAALVNLTTAQIRAHVALGVSELMLGNFDAALKWGAMAEWLLDDVFWVAQHPIYGSVLNVFSDMYYGRATNLAVLGAAKIATAQNATGGEAEFRQAQGFYDQIGYANGSILISALQAYALSKAGRFDAALKAADTAITKALAQGLDDMVWRVEAVRGEVLLDQNEPAEAEAAFRRAQTAMEQAIGSLSTDRAKRRFGIGKEDVTRRLAMLDRRRGDMSKLFQDMERGRARAFVDMLAERQVAEKGQATLVNRIRAIDADIRRLRITASAFKGQAGDAKSRLNELLRNRAGLTRQLSAADAELAGTMAISTRTLANVQAALGPADVMLYFIPAGSGAKAAYLAITRTGAKVTELRPTMEQFRLLIRDFADTVEATNKSRQSRLATRLTGLLSLPPVKPGGTIYAVPTGPFYFLPWGALEISSPAVVLPTGGWLLRDQSTVPTTGSSAVVLGDPDFGGAFEQLPGARQEAINVSTLYGKSPLIGDAAGKSSLRQSVGDGVSILHLATHGLFDADRPLNSAIVLGGKATDRLTASELFEKPVAAKLVVLSACETGAGEAVAGDDFLGLARSLYLGGARVVVNRLWPVEDRGTRLFMETFHREAKSGNVGRAWLKARNTLKAQGLTPSVYGAFILGGAAKI